MKRSTVLLVAATAAATFATAALASSTERYRASTVVTASPLEGSRSARGGDWSENFDSYAAGSQIIGQGGWEGWMGDPNAGALVDDEFSVSEPNSINVSGPTDIVQQFSGLTSGAYTVTAQQYIPSGFAGQSYFILQNTYTGTTNWSTQVTFDSATGQAANTGSSAGSIPYVTDEWVEIRVEIDLDANTQTFFYDGQQLYSGTWTEEVSGGGALNIASMNLFANGASPVYYDDISLVAVGGGDFDVEVSADPDSGEAFPGETVTYTVTVENTGIADDTYDITVDADWTATPSVATIDVDAGDTGSFDVEVEVPASATAGESDVATVTVTSQGDDTVSASVNLTTTAGDNDCIFANGFEEGGDGSCDDGAGNPDIVDSGPVSLAVPDGADVQLNLVTGEFGPYDSFPGADINWYPGTGGVMFFYVFADVEPDQATVADAEGSDQTAVLESGDTIGPDSPFTSAGQGNTSNWVGGTSGYIGVRFLNEDTGELNYGYIEFQTTGPNGFPATATRFVYNSAGDSITIP